MDGEDLFSLVSVCRTFRSLLEDPKYQFWKRMYLQQSGVNVQEVPQNSSNSKKSVNLEYDWKEMLKKKLRFKRIDSKKKKKFFSLLLTLTWKKYSEISLMQFKQRKKL